MLLASSGVAGASSKTYVDDLFVSYLRTGNGTSQSVTTGFQPDLVWTKSRSAATGHRLVDSTRGAGNSLESNSTLAQQSETTGITAFNSSGYSVGADSDYNTSAATYVDWCWKKAPKFFDVVTYTGDGVAGRQIPHSLGVAPGMIIVRRTDIISNWFVYHVSVGKDNAILLNTTDASVASSAWNNTAPTVSVFSVTGASSINGVGGTYVAYLFAHDPSADGIIQCGSFTTDASGNATVNLGWEPQFLMHKAINDISNWGMVDTMRGFVSGASAGTGDDRFLMANSSNAEGTTNVGRLTATGFEFNQNTNTTYIYIAIRRSNKPPTTGTQVYNAIASTGGSSSTPCFVSGWPVDFAMLKNRAVNSYWAQSSRLQGAVLLDSSSASAESANSNFTFDYPNGFSKDPTASSNYFGWMFRRAPGFFDVVCYTGTGGSKTIPHSLGAAPELIIVKSRGASGGWGVYSKDVGADKYLQLSAVYAPASDTCWQNTHPTASNFYISNGSSYFPSDSAVTFVAYLFASLPGISKIGSYTGNGSSQTINCGFAAGARFILIKRTDAAGDWYVWDSVRGIVAANDPHLSLNTTAAEVTTDDSVDPNAIGFDVLQNTATNINVLNATYIYLAIA